MEKLKNNQRLLDFLFENMRETPLVLSYLQGYMGEGWVDNIDNPGCGQILLGDFSIVAGDYQAPLAASLIRNIPDQSNSPWFLIIPENENWGSLVEEEFPKRNYKLTRYALKNDTVFFKEKLQEYVDGLSGEYQLKRIDEQLYQLCLQHPQLKDLCSHFLSARDYVKRGLGFCILHGARVVCGASSYSVYDKGIELEVDTDENYRRQGLASACVSQLILECLDKNIYPRWDAASEKSLAFAQKLGYEFSHTYTAYAIKMQ